LWSLHGAEGRRRGGHGTAAREEAAVLGRCGCKRKKRPGCAAWAEWSNWPVGRLGRLGRNLKRNPFRIKIGFLNLSMLWKFVLGDLGGILMWGLFLNSSRLLKDFRKI
jgi:hypothetical protein